MSQEVTKNKAAAGQSLRPGSVRVPSCWLSSRSPSLHVCSAFEALGTELSPFSHKEDPWPWDPLLAQHAPPHWSTSVQMLLPAEATFTGRGCWRCTQLLGSQARPSLPPCPGSTAPVGCVPRLTPRDSHESRNTTDVPAVNPCPPSQLGMRTHLSQHSSYAPEHTHLTSTAP